MIIKIIKFEQKIRMISNKIIFVFLILTADRLRKQIIILGSFL